MKIIFLRVGIDRGCGGRLSPKFSDGKFEYVPIPESQEVLNGRGLRYTDIKARTGGTLDHYSGSTGFAHYDPEFESFTYGEPNVPKTSQMKSLEKGDYLVFYAGFEGDGIHSGTCFVIGYFCVESVFSMPDTLDEWPPASLSFMSNNAHFRRLHPEPTLVIVKGNKQTSRLLDRAVQLSDEDQNVLSELVPVLGFNGSVKRAVGRWVKGGHENKVLEWLR